MTLETLSEHASFGGVQGFYRHASSAIGLPMQFSIFQPPPAQRTGAALVYLAGLTCSEETFPIKAGAQRVAAELGLTLIAPDTSPRRTGIAGEDAEWDFGSGAGFYLDATEAPWSAHFRMETYVVDELLAVAVRHFGADRTRIGLCGHSMGGHGALTLALRHPGVFKSLSALAPIVAPSTVPWGEKAFGRYLGADRAAWSAHDASALMRRARTPYPHGILIDQGLADKFLDAQLRPDIFEQACATAAQPLTLRRHAGYDHGYYFIASFIEDHLRFHAQRLG
jgi:S-formylglutathione hydrolase